MKTVKFNKVIAVFFLVVALVSLGLFISSTNFSYELKSWFSLNYYTQFAPYALSGMLLYSGIYLFKNKPKTNFALAVYGYTIVEIMALDLVGFSPNNLGDYTTYVFIGCALIALWIAHNNSFGLKKLSLKQILISLIIGAIESLFLFYFGRLLQ